MTNFGALNNLLGKTIVARGDLIGQVIQGNPLQSSGEHVCILRHDGLGWRDSELEKVAAKMELTLPARPTFWYVHADELIGFVSPMCDILPQAPHVDAIPTTPVEPTAPMTSDVLQMLRAKGDVTGIEAMGVLRCRDLPKRISELRKLGHNIVRSICRDHRGQRYARYTIVA